MSLCCVLASKLPMAGWQAAVNSADCQGCSAVCCPRIFAVAFLFIRDNNLAKSTGRCCWNYTAGVDEGGTRREK